MLFNFELQIKASFRRVQYSYAVFIRTAGRQPDTYEKILDYYLGGVDSSKLASVI